MSKEINIQIAASAGVGKTALATEIQNYLKFRGFECYNIDVDNYETNFARTSEQHDQALTSIKAKGTKIIISTKQTRISSNSEKNYMVLLNGKQPYYVNTTKEAWDIINGFDMGSTFQVLSPTDKDVSEFENVWKK